MTSELRFTDTNAADDSKGRTWGLEGDLFWIVVGGGFAFVMILLLCFSALKMGLMTSILIAAVPLTLCLIYIFVFRQGKPAGYDMDCLDHWLNGSGFSSDFQRQPKHPLKSLSADFADGRRSNTNEVSREEPEGGEENLPSPASRPSRDPK